ncbi:MAG TPA: hypothetical protein VJM33_04575, partial [Microthrixaceae bacterium]|nr:hypothetical protein [Microthrixaceae bacterium]
AAEVAAALGVAKRNYEAAKAELEAARAEADDHERRDAEHARSAREQEAAGDTAAPGARGGGSAAATRSARARREARERDRGLLEWCVLARMAQQRSLSFVGSVPLVLDDAFANWPHEDLGEVLERLQRMSDVIQVIVLSDDVDLLRWARDLGRDRAAVLDLATI